MQSLSSDMLLDFEKKRRSQAEAQLQTILEMNRSMNAQGVGSEESGMLALQRQLMSMKLKVSLTIPPLSPGNRATCCVWRDANAELETY